MQNSQPSGLPLRVELFAHRVRDFARKLWATARRGNRSYLYLEPAVSKVISPNDRLYAVYKSQHGAGEYFTSALRQLDTIDAQLEKYAKKKLTDCQSIADYACHYGRLLRCFRAALPHATLRACDIDPAAVNFCVQEFNCTPYQVDWSAGAPSAENDLVTCISLVTHTQKDFFSRVLGAWERMLKPGGLLLFTYLGERYIDEWLAGKMEHYGKANLGPPIYEALKQEKAAEFRQLGHTFCGFRTHYSDADEYGIGFMRTEIVAGEIAKHPALEFLESLPGLNNSFGQDLAMVRKLPK